MKPNSANANAKVVDQKVLDEQEEVEDKILHLLGIYPIISPTMLQAALGPYLKPKIWRPALTRLLEAGRLIQKEVPKETPKGRYNSYTQLMVPGTTVNVSN